MENMPHVNPKFDPKVVLRATELEALGLEPVGEFRIVGREFKIDDTDVGGQGWVIAFVVDSEVVLITGTEGLLDNRLRDWQRDVTRGLRGGGKSAAKSWHEQNKCLDALMARYGRGTVFAKLGTEAEKLQLLERYHPRANRSDR